jgi:hypothetical protein
MTVVKARLNNQWVDVSGGSQWDTAWGIVAMGSFLGGSGYSLPVGTNRFTNLLPFTSIVGRRYRMVLQIRLILGPTNGSGVNFLPRGAGPQGSSVDAWVSVPSGYGSTHLEAIFDGNAQPSSYYWDATVTAATSAYLDTMSYFYIEDMGPTTSIAVQSLSTPWTSVTFQGGWYQYPDSQFAPVGYRKIGDIVFLRGLTAGGTPTLPVFTLPAGFRPPYTLHVVFASNAAPVYGHMKSNGEVTPSGGNTGWVDLSSIQFSTTP